jgi:5-methylcytosine-specific restriction protein A
MPLAPLHPCAAPSCPNLVTRGRCVAHGGTGQPERSWARPSRFAALRSHGTAWQALRREVLDSEPWCHICGRPGDSTDIVDHVVSLGEGGTDDRANLRRAHRECHARKTAGEAARARR